MAKRIFSAGFVWSVIEKKWPGFEAAFLGFEPHAARCSSPTSSGKASPATSASCAIRRRSWPCATTRSFVADIAREHGSFGKFLAQWPAGDQVGLLELLGKRGARLGGRTGQYFLRFIGKDCFVTSADVVACLRDAGLDISESPTSKKDLQEDPGRSSTPGRRRPGLPLTHLSRICAMSIGENYDAETLRSRAAMDE